MNYGRAARRDAKRTGFRYFLERQYCGIAEETESGLQEHSTGLEALPGSTLPRAETGRMCASFMLRVVIGMSHRRCCQKPVHDHKTEQQRPHEARLFMSRHHNKNNYRIEAALIGSGFCIFATTSLIICSVSKPPLMYSCTRPC